MMLVVLILSFVALGASVVGLAIPYWLYISYNGAKEYAGLWVDCVKVHIASNCFSLDSVGRHNENICCRNNVECTSPKTAVALNGNISASSRRILSYKFSEQ